MPSRSQQTVQWSPFQEKNLSLESEAWEDRIVWDEEDAPVQSPCPLILDENDKDMLLISRDSLQQENDQPLTENLPTPTSGFGSSDGVASAAALARARLQSMKDISLDADYSIRRASKNRSVQRSIQHAVPAYKLSFVKPTLATEELRNFHRPRAKFAPNKIMRILPARGARTSKKDKTKQTLEASSVLRHKNDLSARDGSLVLMEYLEELPLLLSNRAMASKIHHYYRVKQPGDKPTHNYTDGVTVVLGEDEESPFLGDIEPGTTVSSLENNLFRSPIHEHEPPTTDFLLVRSKHGNKFFLREIPKVFTVGQQQPLMEVPVPKSRNAMNYLKKRLQVYLYRLFQKQKASAAMVCSVLCCHCSLLW